MLLSRSSLVSLLLFCGIAASLPREPVSSTIVKSKNPIPGRYIVKLKSVAPGQRQASPAFSGITHRWAELNGFAGNFSSDTLQKLLASPDVDFIEEDGIFSIQSESQHETRAVYTQTDATWGLGRISQDTKLASQNTAALFTHTYAVPTPGKGVDIYILDTGVYFQHNDFKGRARWGATFGGYPNADGNGHGTHTAGTAAGTKYGVAKFADIIAVKVLSDAGSGSVSDIISGINFIKTSAAASGRPSVILAPVGGGASAALDSAVVAATSAGVHFVTTAGNSNADASNFSPGRVPSAITVGASTIADTISSSSNYGPAIKLFAPGQSVLSTWIGSPDATNIISGGSSAAAHVAGLAAYLLGILGTTSTITLGTALETTAVRGALTNVPAGTVNLLANNNIARLGLKL